MKTKFHNVFIAFAWLVFATLSSPLSTVLAQGSLTPPGAPAPIMKSLDQIEPRRPISSVPYTITNAGSYYLTTNATGVSNLDGITVSAGNVTIDLSGFALFGVSNSHSGIYVSGSYSNITIRNGSLTGWGYNGVDSASAGPGNILLERLNASGNGSAGIDTGNASLVRDCLCEYNAGAGLQVSGSAVVSGCVLNYNTNTYAAGLSVFGDCLVSESQMNFNYVGLAGFSRCTARNCQFNTNASDGIFIYYNSMPSVLNCTSDISGSAFLGNAQDGIYMYGGAGNTGGSPGIVSDCHVAGNGQTGIYLQYSPGSKVTGCNVVGNGLSGIFVGGDGSRVVANNCQGNNSGGNTNNAGVVISGNYCLVEDNHFTDNGYVGIVIQFGISSIVVKNTINDGYNFGSGNDIGPIGPAATATSPWANIFH